jgi:hypothetical protein
MNPPSVVCWTLLPQSLLFPPNVLVHSVSGGCGWADAIVAINIDSEKAKMINGDFILIPLS